MFAEKLSADLKTGMKTEAIEHETKGNGTGERDLALAPPRWPLKQPDQDKRRES